MPVIKQTLFRITKQARRALRPSSPKKRFVHANVPYFSQWESPKLVEKIVTKKLDTSKDPNWQKSGAASIEEYTTWSWNGCGMACTKMVLAKQLGRTIPLVELGKKCAEYGGYPSLQPGSAGLLYAPYVRFLKAEYDLHAKITSPLLLMEIVDTLSDGDFIIASVSPMIRKPTSKPETKGGHLILMTGYDLDKKVFYLHNPSGIDAASQEYAEVSFTDFKKFFSGRGIVIKS